MSLKLKEKELLRARELIYRNQMKEIEKVYEGIGDAIGAEINVKGEDISETDLILMKKELKISLEDARKKIEKIITENIKKVAMLTIAMHTSFLGGVDEKYNTNFKSNYNDNSDKIINNVANKLLLGELYKDKITLSQRIWQYDRKALKDINKIISQGYKNGTSIYNIAKDLEKYVRPSAKKDWNWSKVYAGTSKKIDYNAQRLARTSITHAYQEAYKESVRENPFIEYIEYNSAHNARTCQMCSERDGQKYKIDDAPLDHANGNCFYTSVIPNNIESLIADYVNKNF